MNQLGHSGRDPDGERGSMWRLTAAQAWVKPQLTSLKSLKNLVWVLILPLIDRATCTPNESLSFLICKMGLKQFLSQGVIQRVKKIAVNCVLLKMETQRQSCWDCLVSVWRGGNRRDTFRDQVKKRRPVKSTEKSYHRIAWGCLYWNTGRGR